MPKTNSPSFKQLLQKLSVDFPHYTFQKGEVYSWSPDYKTITWAPSPYIQAVTDLLHELAHAELGHTDYNLDIELIRYESAAWQYAAATLAPAYGIRITDQYIEDSLEGYRAWLHDRSLCSSCAQTGIQTNKNVYSCINCRHSWVANDARQCKLRRKHQA